LSEPRTLNGETQTLARNIAYAPFGPMTGLTFGNGVPMNRYLDLDYRKVSASMPRTISAISTIIWICTGIRALVMMP